MLRLTFWPFVALAILAGYLLVVAEFIAGTAFDDIAERWATQGMFFPRGWF